MTGSGWLKRRLPRLTKTRSIPALAISIAIHGALLALILAGVSRGPSNDLRDSQPRAGIVGSADHGNTGGIGGAIAAPPSGPSLSVTDGAQYVGQYLRQTQSEGSSLIRVDLINDGEAEPHWALIVTDGDRPVQKLVLIARDTFALQLAPKQRVVFRRLGDSITAMSVRRGRDTTWAERAPLEWRPSNEALKPSAHGSEAAGSLRSPAALLIERRGLTPAR